MPRLTTLLMLALMLSSGAATAQHIHEQGDFVVYATVLSTDFLTPEVARSYGITRSRTRGLVNLSVQRKQSDGMPQPVSARIEASARNLSGQLREVSFREVREDWAIYYLGELRVSHTESFDFDLEIQPEASPETLRLRFRHQFFTD